MPGKVRVGIIGLGIGTHHARWYSDSPYAQVTALCDVNEELLKLRAKEFGVARTFTDYAKMLAEVELDAVSVCTPNYLHAPVTIEALGRGLHVLCEKPLALTAKEVRKILRMARERSRLLMVNFAQRFLPQARVLKAVIDNGEIGDIYFGRTWWLRNRGVPRLGSWFGQKDLSGGGPLIDIGVHRLDMALWLMGFPEPEAVSGVTYNVIGDQIARAAGVKFDVEDLAAGLVRFRNGASLIVLASWAANSEKREDMLTELYGTKGGVIHRNINEKYEFEAKVFKETGGAYTETSFRFQTDGKPTSATERFARCIATGEEPEASAEESLVIAKIIDALYESARRGKEVTIPKES